MSSYVFTSVGVMPLLSDLASLITSTKFPFAVNLTAGTSALVFLRLHVISFVPNVAMNNAFHDTKDTTIATCQQWQTAYQGQYFPEIGLLLLMLSVFACSSQALPAWASQAVGTRFTDQSRTGPHFASAVVSHA